MNNEPETIEELMESFVGSKITAIFVDPEEDELNIVLDTDQIILLGGDGVYVKRLSPSKEFLN